MEIAKTVILVIIIIIGGVKKVHCTQDDSYSGQGFLNKITGKIFQNFELYFLNFFYLHRKSSMKNRGKMIEQHSALKRILWSWQHPLYESKYQKKFGKKKISIGSLSNNPWIFWPFHALWQSYRKSTKKVAFSMPVIKFLLSFDINHRKRMCDVSWIIKGWLWLFSSFQCSLSSPKVSMSEGVIWQLSYCRFYLYVGNVWKKLQSKMVLENMHRIIIIIQGVPTSYG